MSQISTQDQICAYLQTHPTASAIELSRVLGLTVPNIRHHLDALLVQGKVEKVGKRSQSGRGRPTIYYTLGVRTKQNNFPLLAAALLGEMLDGASLDKREEYVRGTARRIAETFGSGKAGLTSRLNQSVHALNEMHYQARWEARAEGPKLFFANCPYLTILAEHPELCELDRHILEQLLQIPCHQIDRIDLQSDSHPQCVFLVGNS